MKRLTSNKNVKDMRMLELAYNSCYIQDGEARYRDYENDFDARELAKELLKTHADIDISDYSDSESDEYLVELLQDGFDGVAGLIAVLYRTIWTMAEIREKLKMYENYEELLEK